MTISKSLRFTLVWPTILAFCILATGLAVDQSKFRTCEQTSFCRRHRGQHSASLYQYRIDESSVVFHLPNENRSDLKSSDEGSIEIENREGENIDENAGAGTGIWKSFQDRILGSKPSDKDSDESKDPYVKGPPPTLTGILVNTAEETSTGKKEHLEFSIFALADGLVRVRITEIYRTRKRDDHHRTAHDKARITYDELVLSYENLKLAENAQWIQPGDAYLLDFLGSQEEANRYMGLRYGDHLPTGEEKGMILLLRLDSFAIYLYREGDSKEGPVITMGDKKMTHFEIRRNKENANVSRDDPTSDGDTGDDQLDETMNEKVDPKKEIVGYWEDGLAIYADGTREERKENIQASNHRQLSEMELDRDGMWEEKFGDHLDTKPRGPMSVGSDITFPGSKFLFGLPEHASSTVLKRTIGKNSEYKHPYRLYNLDVFEYDLDVPMALYGAVPLIVSQSTQSGTSGVFWFNPTETFVDIDEDDNGSKTSHWMSESGIIDVFFIPGPTPTEFYRQYGMLTGTTPLPPIFSLGYHQCRWNYNDEKDVCNVHDKFEELDYPYDVLWLDIEHTDGKRYFTWDKKLFPHPSSMQQKLWSQGRRMVRFVPSQSNKFF